MIDKNSETWRLVSAKAEADLASLRESLEVPGTDHEQSQIIRGRIMALKDILQMGDVVTPPSRKNSY